MSVTSLRNALETETLRQAHRRAGESAEGADVDGFTVDHRGFDPSDCTVTAASRRSSPSLISLHVSMPPVSERSRGPGRGSGDALVERPSLIPGSRSR